MSWDRHPAIPYEWYDAEVQSDEWDREEEPGAVDVVVNNPIVNPELNMQCFAQCTNNRVSTPTCMHDALVQCRQTANLEDDMWYFIEPSLRRRVYVSQRLCVDCQIDRDVYLGLCNHWKLLNAT